jgi:hypothetical protein
MTPLKSITIIICTLLAVSCTKRDIAVPKPHLEKSETCAVIGSYDINGPDRPHTEGDEPGVILLKFDGHFLPAGTYWDAYNAVDSITCQPAGYSTATKDTILWEVQDKFSPLNIIITMDSSVYNAGPTDKRTIAVITPTTAVFTSGSSVQGAACGNAFQLNGTNSPHYAVGAFIFSSRLPVDGAMRTAEQITRVIAHEVGHTMNAHHVGTWIGGSMSWYTGGGWINNSKSSQVGIMSLTPLTRDKICNWWIGGNQISNPNNNINDLANFAAMVGWKEDEDANGTITLDLSGVDYVTGILHQDDVDTYQSTDGTDVTITTGHNDTLYASIDLKAEVYNASNVLQATYDISDDSDLKFFIPLSTNWYLKVMGSSSNTYMNKVNMTGTYRITRP